MIFGGLEIVAGGYFAHKYYKNKSEKKKLEENVQYGRNNISQTNRPSSYPLQPHFQHQEQHAQYHCPQQAAAPQKHACHAPIPIQSPCSAQPRPQQLRPKPTQAQSFNIPRRPVPQQQTQIIFQPSLQRADSMATLSRMPIANGYRPSRETEPAPPHRRQTVGLSPVQQSPYCNAAFSVSSPAFGATQTSPPISYVMASDARMAGHAVDNVWVSHEHEGRYSAYAPTEASTQLGERDPPPPYMP